MSAIGAFDPYGIFRVEPCSISRTEFALFQNINVTHNNECVIIGECDGGTPANMITKEDQMLRFSPSEYATTKSVIGEGLMMDLARRMWDCSPNERMIGANYITFIRAVKSDDPPTQAKWIMKDDGSQTIGEITTLGYGLPVNYIRRKVENGSFPDTKKITLQYKTNDPEVFDKLGHGLAVMYKGSSGDCVLKITVNSKDEAITLTASIAGEGLKINLDLTKYSTINQVAQAINEYDDFEAIIPHWANPSLPCKYLDPVNGTGHDIKKQTGTADDLTATVLTDEMSWETNELVGRLLYPSATRSEYYRIKSNTENTITVETGLDMTRGGTVTKGAYYIGGYICNAYQGSIIHEMSQRSQLARWTKDDDAIGNYYDPPANTNPVWAYPDTPGTYSTPDADGYTESLALLSEYYPSGGFILPATTTRANKNAVYSFMKAQRSLGIAWKIGMAVDQWDEDTETKADYSKRLKDEALYYNHTNTIVVGGGIVDTDISNVKQTYGNMYSTAEIIGGLSGVGKDITWTNKQLRAEGLECVFSPTLREQQLESGVMALKLNKKKQPIVVLAITTHTSTDKRGERILFCSCKRDYINAFLQEHGEGLIASESPPLTANLVRTHLFSGLESLQKDGHIITIKSYNATIASGVIKRYWSADIPDETDFTFTEGELTTYESK